MLQRAASRWGRSLPQQLSQAWRQQQQQQQWQQRCLLASEGGSGASSSGSAASSSSSGPAAAAAASSSNAASTSSSPKSMLDSSFVHQGAAGQVLGTAAEARMHRLQQEAAEQAAAAAAAAGQGSGAAGSGAAATAAAGARRVLGWLGDVLMVGGIAAVATGGYLYTAYDVKDLQHMMEETEKEEENQFFGHKAWLAVVKQYVQLAAPLQRKVREYTDPSCDKLLPDMAPEHRGRIKTLVLDLDDLLVHKEWSRARGWQVYKRPGAADFIYQMGQYYELVMYTDETNMYADPIINRLDPYRVIPYRLYRQDTQYVNGKHVRDLSKLNRDPSQVMFLSANPDAYSFQPQNTLKLKPWSNDPKDTTLLDLIPFLQMVATKGVPDVRHVVRSYDGEEDVAKAFKDRMAHLTDAKKGSGGGGGDAAGGGSGGGGLRRGRGLFSGGLATQ